MGLKRSEVQILSPRLKIDLQNPPLLQFLNLASLMVTLKVAAWNSLNLGR